jgi:hypothetical protein
MHLHFIYWLENNFFNVRIMKPTAIITARHSAAAAAAAAAADAHLHHAAAGAS